MDYVFRALSDDEFPAWRTFAARSGALPTAWPSFYLACRASFSPELRAFVLLREGAFCAVLTLEVSARGVIGRTARAPHNEHHPYYSLAWDHEPETARQLGRALAEEFDVVSFERVLLGDELWELLDLQSGRSAEHILLPSTHTADVSMQLVRPLERFRKERSHRVHVTTRQKQRKLEKAGKLTFMASTDFDEPLFEECLKIETLGWKAREGVPILSDPKAAMFYRTLAREAAVDGTYCLYQIRLDDRLIAYGITLRAGRRADVLKISFHPDSAPLSPGSVLSLLSMEWEVEGNVIDEYHVGGPSEYKQQWIDQTDVVGSARYYFGLRGRAQYWSGPGLRPLIQKYPRVRERLSWAKEKLSRT